MEDKVKFHREPLKQNWTLRTDNKTTEELIQEHEEFCNRPEIINIRNHGTSDLLKRWDEKVYGVDDPDNKLEQRFDGPKYLGVFDKETGEQITAGVNWIDNY